MRLFQTWPTAEHSYRDWQAGAGWQTGAGCGNISRERATAPAQWKAKAADNNVYSTPSCKSHTASESCAAGKHPANNRPPPRPLII